MPSTAAIVKPGPMSLTDIDERLTVHAVALASTTAPCTAELRELVMLDVDRLLDVRLAIMERGEA